jgi:hypothetical protein
VGELDEPGPDAIVENGQALRKPALVLFPSVVAASRSTIGGLHRRVRGEHPGNRTSRSIGIVGQQARVAFGDVEHDRAGFEQL